MYKNVNVRLMYFTSLISLSTLYNGTLLRSTHLYLNAWFYYELNMIFISVYVCDWLILINMKTNTVNHNCIYKVTGNVILNDRFSYIKFLQYTNICIIYTN